MKTNRRGFLGLMGVGAAALTTGTAVASTESVKVDYTPTEKELKFINKLINQFIKGECNSSYLEEIGDMPLVVSGDLYNGEAQFHIQTQDRLKCIKEGYSVSLKKTGQEPYVNKLRDVLSSNTGGGDLSLVWGPDLESQDKGMYISTSLAWRGRSHRMNRERVDNIANHIGHLLKEMGYHVIVSITVEVEAFRNEGVIG